jgi:hypothetical protein
MNVIFFNVQNGDPRQLELDHIPRTGDEITLDSGVTYRVESVRWQFTTAGLREAGLTLQVLGSQAGFRENGIFSGACPVTLDEIVERLSDALEGTKLNDLVDIADLLLHEEHIRLGRHGLTGSVASTASGHYVVTDHVTSGGQFTSLHLKRFN